MSWSAAHRQFLIRVVWKRDGPRCWLCGDLFSKARPLTIDHAIPKARGGSNELHNLRLAHADCNQERGCIQSTAPKAARLRAEATQLSTA